MSIWTILLLILKGIGILLLGLLGLTAVLILLFLFLPFSYAGQGVYAGTLLAQARFSWLFHVLGIRLYYDGVRKEDQLRWQLCLFGIPVLDSIRLERKRNLRAEKNARTAASGNGGKKSRTGRQAPGQAVTAKSPMAADKTVQETANAVQDKTAKTVIEIERSAAQGGANESKTPAAAAENRKAAIQAKENRKPPKRESIRKHIRYTFRTICDKIKQIWENFTYYKEFLEKEETRQAFLLCRNQLLGLLRHIRPKRFHARLILGTGDPASTGQLAACYGAAFPLVGDILEFTPDFERRVLEGDFRLSGHITMFRILRTAWILYFDKNIRKLLLYLNKEDRKHV